MADTARASVSVVILKCLIIFIMLAFSVALLVSFVTACIVRTISHLYPKDSRWKVAREARAAARFQ